MIERKDSTRGSIILETSIVLPMFMLVIMFIYGFFSLTTAQNQMTHALIQSSKSLSLDPYITEHVDSAAESKTFWSSLGSMVLDFARLPMYDKYYTSATDWYKGTGDNKLAKNRFIGYFAGGDETVADQRLKNLHVVDGLDGVDFTMAISGNDMTITMKYEIQFWIDVVNLGKIPVKQSITTKLWKQ